jgi:alkanesulfonate monooxygenase SsuD/methylene tetrahydromethanopterin reductase-like flavin-dependent oxidoreductase (luciferase family)
MDIGIGLPISDPAGLGEWARRAESLGFSTVALLDRLAFDNPEPLVTLAALAGATSRIALQTEVLLGPLRSTALLAKQAATLDVVSAGRFRLGIGLGGRDDDHAAAGVPQHGLGSRLDRQLTDLRSIWRQAPYDADPDEASGAPVGPVPTSPDGPPILIGGFAPRALARVAAHADGFICAASPEWAGSLIDSVRAQWAATRPGRPRIVCQTNAAIGPGGTFDQASRAIADYYAFTGRQGWGAPISDPGQLADTVRAYAELGADEVVLYCWGPDPDQLDRLAALGLHG